MTLLKRISPEPLNSIVSVSVSSGWALMKSPEPISLTPRKSGEVTYTLISSASVSPKWRKCEPFFMLIFSSLPSTTVSTFIISSTLGACTFTEKESACIYSTSIEPIMAIRSKPVNGRDVST